jgi:predicted transposase YdaD
MNLTASDLDIRDKFISNSIYFYSNLTTQQTLDYLMLAYTLRSLIQNKQHVVESGGLCDPRFDKSAFYVAIP